MSIDDKRPAPVSPTVYDPEWVEQMGGWGSNEAFVESGGEVVRPRLAYALELGGVRAGMSILDIGCGRGEVLICCARAGVKRALGVDYAPVSVYKARRNVNAMGMNVNRRQSPLVLLLSDAKKIPLADRSIDRVFMLDIVEHLHEWELQEVWAEVHRILKDEGVLVIHTLPNRWAIDYGYRLARFALRGIPRVAADKRDIFHVNEQSVPSLASSLKRSGLKSRVWIKSLMLRNADYLHDQGLEGEATQNRIYHRLRHPRWRMAFRLAMWLPTRLLFATDVFALAWKSSSPPAVIRDLPPNFSERLACLFAAR